MCKNFMVPHVTIIQNATAQVAVPSIEPLAFIRVIGTSKRHSSI